MKMKKLKLKKKPIICLALALGLGVGIALNNQAQAEIAALEYTKVSDDSTSQDWQSLEQNTTKNTGRIWTDKSVSTNDITLANTAETGDKTITIGSSDFLVELSALSSISNLTSSTTSAVPNDIVLVLDVSGSMDDSISLGGSSTKKITALKSAVNTFIDATAKANSGLDQSKQSRISIVKFAGKKSDSVGNEYYNEYYGRGWRDYYTYNYSQRVTELKYVTSETTTTATGTVTANALKTTVNSFTAAGATSADYAMQLAQTALSNSRSEANKIIIFFTDGEPTHGNSYDSDVAGDAVDTAKNLKTNATIYTVGIFSGASSSDTTKNNANIFMNGLSSNYPNATSSNRASSGISLGTKAEGDPSYYLTASTADGLTEVFKSIQESISSSTSGSPTSVQEGYDETKSGYITFSDTLGDYMEFDDVKSIVFANKQYEWDGTITKDGTVVTDTSEAGTYQYTFKSTEVGSSDHTAYPTGNLQDIVITVEKSEDLQTGDTVTVKVPASLIPVKKFTITTANNESTYSETNTWPIRVFYGVSIKDKAEAYIANPDSAMSAYIKANSTTDGKVNFYSNSYTNGSETGDTTSTFEPSQSNNFYYFTEDTPIYTDKDCTTRLKTEPVSGTTYYYQHTYYTKGEENADGTYKAVQKSENIAIDGSYLLTPASGKIAQDDNGNYYIVKGNARLSDINSLHKDKTKNTTGTAEDVINPSWFNTANPTTIVTYLGNNGKKSYDLPATLSLTKIVEAADGFALPDDASDKEFTFTLTLQNSNSATLSGNYRAVITDSEGTAVSEDDYTVTNNTKVKLKKDQTLTVYGLPKDAKYSISETSPDNHYTQKSVTVSVNGTETNNVDASGTLEGGMTTSVVFTNEYKAEETSVSNTFKVTKNFSNVDSVDTSTNPITYPDDAWNTVSNVSFNMHLEAISYTDVDGVYHAASADNMPLPEGSSAWKTHDSNNTTHYYLEKAVNKNAKTADFGTIKFTKPGIYVYNLHEETGSDTGVSYGGERYRVTVTVTDNNGKLSASTVIEQVMGTAGAEFDKPVALKDAGSAVIHNVYSLEQKDITVSVTKRYTDTSGSNPLTANKFSFKVSAATDYDGNVLSNAPQLVDTNLNTNYTKTNGVGNAADGSVGLGGLRLTTSYVGNTYYYEFYEILPAGVTEANNYTANGMTYDAKHYRAVVYVYSNDGAVDCDISYEMKSNDGTWIAVNGTPSFENTYDPEDYTLTNGLAVSKTLTGRAPVDGEAYTFTASLTSGPVGGASLSSDTETSITVASKDTAATSGILSGTSFSKPGTYTFTISENIPETQAVGMTYDTSTWTATVKIKDRNGKLVQDGDITYTKGGDSTNTTAAAFVNQYSQTVTDSGLSLAISKTLTGRNMSADEFTFKVYTTNADAASHLVNASEENGETYVTFNRHGSTQTIGNPVTLQLSNFLTFDQDDIGKTFTYNIAEVIPDETNGVTYDTTTYSFTVEVKFDATDGLYLEVKQGDNTRTNKASETDKSVLNFGTFNNAYNASGTGSVYFSKQIMNRNWAEADSFEFILSAQSNTAGIEVTSMPGNGKTAVISYSNGTVIENTEVKDKNNNYSFSSAKYTGITGITFTQPGTYYYNLLEKGADGSWGSNGNKDGISYDQSSIPVVFTVTDNRDGTLAVAVSLQDVENSEDAIKATTTGTFVNKYDLTVNYNAAADIRVTKTLSGRDMAESDSFTFTVKPNADEDNHSADKIGLSTGETTVETTAAGNTAADGQAVNVDLTVFDNLTFSTEDSGKTFTYTVTEKIPAEAEDYKLNGITYDTSSYKIEITPTDSMDGKMTIKTVVTKGETSTTYERTLPDTTKAIADSIDLGFTNTYSAAGSLSSAIEGTKNIYSSASTWQGDKSGFTFRMVGNDEFTQNAINKGYVTLSHASASGLGENGYFNVTTDKDGKFTFGTMSFSQPGTYTFTIYESEGKMVGESAAAGWYNTQKRVDMTVTVTNAGEEGTPNGTLTVSGPTYSGYYAEGTDTSKEEHNEAGDNLTFTNVYTTTAGTFTPSVVKAVTGKDMSTGESFSFTLTAADTKTQNAITNGYIKAPEGTAFDSNYSLTASTATIMTNGSNETVNFPQLTFTSATGDGDYYIFNVTENHSKDEDDNTAGCQNNGWTMDEHTYQIKLYVQDDNSQLKVIQTETGVEEANRVHTFTNTTGSSTTYGALGGVEVTKTLNGGTYLSAGDFKFTIKAADGDSAAAEKLSRAYTGTSEFSDGKLTFGNTEGVNGKASMRWLDRLVLSTDDKDKTFTYIVNEVNENKSGYTYDSDKATVAITVKEDNGKVYTETVVTKGNKEYKTVTKDSPKAATVPFVNVYKAETSGSGAVLSATKTLYGRDLLKTNADKLTFNAKDNKGTTLVSGKIDTSKATDNVVAKDGTAASISFGSIKATTATFSDSKEYFKSEDGTTTISLPMAVDTGVATHSITGGQGSYSAGLDQWTFKITVSEEGTLAPNVTQRQGASMFTIDMVVTDNGDGTLDIQFSYPSGNSLSFINDYTPDTAKLTPVAYKAISGRLTLDASEAGLSFTLATNDQTTIEAINNGYIKGFNNTENSTTVSAVSTLKANLTSGNERAIYFPQLEFTKTGTYTFTMTENDFSAEAYPGWTKDSTQYTLTVTVTDDPTTGKLVAASSITNDTETVNNAVFTNTYTMSESVLTSGSIVVEKNIKGREWNENDSFTFSIEKGTYTAPLGTSYSVDAYPMPAETTVTVNSTSTVTKGDAVVNHAAAFGDITYSVPGYYTYTVREQLPGSEDSTDLFYDETSYVVTVLVSDNGNGTLSAAVSSISNGSSTLGGDANIVFNNVSSSKTAKGAVVNGNVKVGETITYEIAFANTKDQAADITITDSIPAGTTFVKDSQKVNVTGVSGDITFTTYDADQNETTDGTVASFKCVVKNVPAYTSGTMTFNVVVNADAVTYSPITNTAGIQIGNNTYKTSTNTSSTDVSLGALTISKKVENNNVGTTTEFSFTVALNGIDGSAYTNAITYEGTGTVENGSEGSVTPADGTITIKLSDDQNVKLNIPEGISYTVKENAVAGYTTTYALNSAEAVSYTDDGVTGVISKEGDTVAFTNTYGNTVKLSDTIDLNFQKKLTGRDASAGEFTFTVSEDSGKLGEGVTYKTYASPALTENVSTALSEIDETFDNIIFDSNDSGKKFTFTVSEVTPTEAVDHTLNGMTYDDRVWKIEAKPTDNGTGSLTVDYTITAYYGEEVDTSWGTNGSNTYSSSNKQSVALAFNNSYGTSGTLNGEADLAGEKTINGSWTLSSDIPEFEYTITPAEDDTAYTYTGENGETVTVSTAQAVKDAIVVMPESTTVKNDEDGKFAFGDITFKHVGTYTFTVTEVNGGKEAQGWIYSKETKQVVVTVSDETAGTQNGKLVCQTRIYGTLAEDDATGKRVGTNNLDFTNKYDHTVTAGSLTLSKSVSGGDATKAFTFNATLTDAKDNALNGTYSYTTVGDDVTITSGEAAGSEGTINIVNGSATITLKDSQSITITGLPEGTKYTITETAVSGFTAEVSVNGAEAAAEAEGGTTGTISEKSEVTVAYTNTYGTIGDDPYVSTEGLFTKKIDGRDWTDSDAFTFTLTGVDGAPIRIDTGDTETNRTATVKKSGTDSKVKFGFGALYYTLSDLDGVEYVNGTRSKTFTYEVKENNGGTVQNGLLYDDHTATLKVTLIDDGNGHLKAEFVNTVENGTFTNISREVDYANLSGIQVTKVLTGRDMTQGQFTWNVVPADAASAEALEIPKTGKTISSNAAKDGEMATMALELENNVKFGIADSGKTFTYTVTEANTTDTGMTISTDTSAKGYSITKGASGYTVTITPSYNETTGVLSVATSVVDNGSKQQTSSAVVDSNTTTPSYATTAFENQYQIDPGVLGEGGVEINAAKILENTELASGAFTFNVTNVKDDSYVTTGTNDASGKVSFRPVTYTAASLNTDYVNGKASREVDSASGAYTYTYTYKIAEDSSDLAEGISAKTAAHDIEVKVVDKHDGSALEVSVVYPEDSSAGLTFRNVYGEDAEDTINVNGIKVLNNTVIGSVVTEESIAHQFTFTITGVDAEGNAAPLPEKTSVTNDAAGNVSFGDITYTIENAGKTYAYTVTETGSAAGIANDTEAKTFTVTVTDDGAGHIEAAPSYGTDASFTFTNSYSVTPVSLSINTAASITKKLDGRAITEGEFTFSLADQNNEIILTSTNAAQGEDGSASISFDAIEYTKPGTYTYTLTEQYNAAKRGVSFSSAMYTYTVTVLDNGDGTLGASGVITRNNETVNSVIFENTYTTTSTTVRIGGLKQLDGGELQDDEFTFIMKDVDSGAEYTTANDASGQILFDEIEYTKAGKYTYEVYEVKGDDANVTYDEMVYVVTVQVEDNNAGSLMVTSTSMSVKDGDSTDKLIFNNTFKNVQPTPTPTSSPKATSTPSAETTATPAPTPSATAETLKGVDTSDSNHLALFGGILIISLASLSFILAYKKKYNR